MKKVVIASIVIGLTLLAAGEATAVSLSIQANGSDGPVNIYQGETLSLTAAVSAEGDSSPANWWIVYNAGGVWHSYVYPNRWVEGIFPAHQGDIATAPTFPFFNGVPPAGAYTFYFALDTNQNGVVDAPLYYDSVRVNILPDDARAGAHDAIVVGAGIAGLTAAWFLKDYNIAVLEKNDRVGGRALSGEHDEYTYAKGTEYLGAPEDPLAQIIEELQLVPREIPAPMDACYYDGSFYWGDDGLAWMYIDAGEKDAYEAFVGAALDLYERYNETPDIDSDPVLGPLDHKTSKEWFDEMGVPAIIQEKYNVAARGLFGASVTEISALGFIPEIAFDFSDELLSDLTTDNIDAGDNTPDQAGVHTDSYTFVNGITEITDAIALQLGDTIRLNAEV
ncbi:MAG: FAD-dependent oxidoreductase, partial [Desulfobacterales bacterium]|nr:FAD-dependent oxidoreductase [Desulfobacterales bacterium]